MPTSHAPETRPGALAHHDLLHRKAYSPARTLACAALLFLGVSSAARFDPFVSLGSAALAGAGALALCLRRAPLEASDYRRLPGSLASDGSAICLFCGGATRVEAPPGSAQARVLCAECGAFLYSQEPWRL